MKPSWQNERFWQQPLEPVSLSAALGVASKEISLTLDPYPGRLGAPLGGAITLTAGAPTQVAFALTLQCIAHSWQGSGDFVEAQESILWEETQSVYASREAEGSRLRFSFESLPADLPESEVPFSGDYNEWRLSVCPVGERAGEEHYFTLPVFELETSREERSCDPSLVDDLLCDLDLNRAAWERQRVHITRTGEQLEIHLPSFRASALNRMLAGLGLGFLLMTGGLVSDDLVAVAVSAAFGLSGMGMAATGFFLLARTVDIQIRAGAIDRCSRLFGVPIVTQTLLASEIESFAIRGEGRRDDGSEICSLYACEPRGEVLLVAEVAGRAYLQELRRAIDALVRSPKRSATRD